jgi:hypothetical protein
MSNKTVSVNTNTHTLSSAHNITVEPSFTVGRHTIDEALLDDLLEARGFIDYACKVDPHFAELWSGYQAKQRILR